jgi:ATP-dependent Lon protease
LLAAHRGGIKLVLIPEENTKDLTEIPDNVKNAIEIIPVRWIDKVLELALERVPAPIPEDEPKAASPVADKKDTPATGDFVKH